MRNCGVLSARSPVSSAARSAEIVAGRGHDDEMAGGGFEMGGWLVWLSRKNGGGTMSRSGPVDQTGSVQGAESRRKRVKNESSRRSKYVTVVRRAPAHGGSD